LLSVPRAIQFSNGVNLTVNANPVVTVSAAPYTSLYPGLHTTLTANVTPASNTLSYVWYQNGSVVANANGATHTVDVDGLGTYTVMVTNTATSCSGSSSNSVTIKDSTNTALFVYPNPNRGLFQVRFNDQSKGVEGGRMITIYDSKGSRVYQQSFNVTVPFGRMDVDLSKKAKGVYHIELTDAAGVRLQTGRVVIF
jgi:hypothetical protein